MFAIVHHLNNDLLLQQVVGLIKMRETIKRRGSFDDDEEALEMELENLMDQGYEDISEMRSQRQDVWANFLVNVQLGNAVCVRCLKGRNYFCVPPLRLPG